MYGLKGDDQFFQLQLEVNFSSCADPQGSGDQLKPNIVPFA